ncbi:hypothetical protein Tco_1011542 [Tanacetum coccineum]
MITMLKRSAAAVAVVSGAQQLISSHGHGAKTILIYRIDVWRKEDIKGRVKLKVVTYGAGEWVAHFRLLRLQDVRRTTFQEESLSTGYEIRFLHGGMGIYGVMRKVSFKLSKRGTRYRPKPKPNPSSLGFVDDEVDDTTSSVVDLTENDDDEDIEEIPDADVSFIVNIFPDGYTIDKSLKSNAAQQIASMYDPKLLSPYDRASQSLFTAIKCCRVPANFFEDIPCTYKNGKVACEVRDWRKDSAEPAGVSINGPSIAAIPSIRRISLRMSVDSIVRDIPQMSKRDFWAYSELLEAEAKILLALYPKLDLDPYPNFDRLCKKPTTVKLNLDFRAMRRKRLRQISAPEKSNLRTDPNVANPATQNVGPPNSVNLATQNVRQIPTMHQLTQDVRQLPRMDQLTQNTSIPKFPWVSHQPEDQFGASGTAFNAPGASSTHALVNLISGNDGINSIMSAFEGGRGNQDSLPSSSMANSDHRNRSNPLSFVGNQQQKIASHNALGASNSAPGASSTHAMQSASSNQDRQSSFMANSNNRNWSDPLALIGNHQQMTLEILDNTPGTAFNTSRASNTRRRSFVSAFDGRTANQDDQSSFPMAFLDGRRSRSNSLVFLGNQQQQQLASHMHYNPARTSVNASGASSSHGMMNLNSNNGGISSSSLVNMDNRNWSNPLANVVNGQSSLMANADNRNQSNPLAIVGNQEQQRASYMQNNTSSQTAANVPGGSSTQGTVSLSSDDDIDIRAILSAFEGNVVINNQR